MRRSTTGAVPRKPILMSSFSDPSPRTKKYRKLVNDAADDGQFSAASKSYLSALATLAEESETLLRGQGIAAFHPPKSQRMKEEGAVTVSADIAESGYVLEARVKVSSGYDSLDTAALDWVETAATFAPATADGKSVRSVAMFNVRFQLVD